MISEVHRGAISRLARRRFGSFSLCWSLARFVFDACLDAGAACNAGCSAATLLNSAYLTGKKHTIRTADWRFSCAGLRAERERKAAASGSLRERRGRIALRACTARWALTCAFEFSKKSKCRAPGFVQVCSFGAKGAVPAGQRRPVRSLVIENVGRASGMWHEVS